MSTSSSNVANNDACNTAASAPHSLQKAICMVDAADDRTAQPDVWGGVCSMLSPGACTSARQGCFAEVQLLPDQLGQPTQLLLGTSTGLYVVNLDTQQAQVLGLQGTTVGHISYHNGLVLASCPVLDDANRSRQQQADAAAAAGLYCVKLGNSSSSSGSSNTSSASCFCDDSSQQTTKVWQGNARCSAFAAPAADSAAGCRQAAVPRIFLGTQPADLLHSDNLGLTWAKSGLASTPEASQWYRMLPPYETAVRSISSSWASRSGSSGSNSAAVRGCGNSCSGCALESTVQEEEQILVGVEVGGAFVSNQGKHTTSETAALPAAAAGSSWADCSQGLCRDVQALQPDPFSSKRLYAVAGSGSLPGGLYRSRGKGQKWKRLFGYRYPVGVAVSPYHKGRMVLVSADKPPEIGCNLFDSIDGGRHWVNVTDDVSDAVLDLTSYAPGVLEHAPAAMFVPGGLVVGCVTGHVFMGTALPAGGYSNWKLLTQLPAAVHCMCLTDASVAPVAINRV